MKISAIVATDLKNGIGRNNKLLCHLPADLKYFKSTTMGHPIIMGRKTYESIGRLLPGRRNILITRRPDYRLDGGEIYHSIDAALQSCSEPEVFIIGGAEIFTQTLAITSVIHRTLIMAELEADTFFPEFREQFHLESSVCHEADEKNHYAYCFETWHNKRPASQLGSSGNH
jgi:dihydrofolate reductase